jgi:4-amino-4-deoxy-L-arabinose transferase-like glycosyltransferase
MPRKLSRNLERRKTVDAFFRPCFRRLHPGSPACRVAVRNAAPGANAVKKSTLALASALCVGTGIRLYLALTTWGSNDVTYWQTFKDWIVQHGSVSIYRGIWYYNHPPMVSGWLWIVHHLQGFAPFPLWIRLPAILADVGNSLLIYRLVRHFWDERRALMSACLVALSPVLIQISGFHGNTDPVFLLLVLVATERLVLGKSPFWSAAFLGLSLNIKVVPLLFTPLFFFALRGRRDRLVWAGTVVGVFILGFGYHFSQEFREMKDNIFDYSGNVGIWGLTKIFNRELLGNERSESFVKLLKYGLLFGVVFHCLRYFSSQTPFTQEWGRRFLQQLSLVTLFFFVVSPGFGVQYLAWLSVLGLFLQLPAALLFQLGAGAFLFTVYTYWCGGLPWNYANSDVMGPWKGISSTLDSLLWLGLVSWFCFQLKIKHLVAR